MQNTADGLTTETAAVELLIMHESWINPIQYAVESGGTAGRGLADFFRYATEDGKEGCAVDWKGLGNWARQGGGGQSGSALRVLEIACSIGGGHPVDLGDALPSLDSTNITYVMYAVASANGRKDDHYALIAPLLDTDE